MAKQIQIEKDIAERIRSEFTSEEFIKTQTREIYRISYKGKRFYLEVRPDEIIKGASATNINRATTPTPFGIMEWRQRLGDRADIIMADAASYGTMMHKIFGEVILGGTFPMRKELIRDYIQNFIDGNTGMADPLDWSSWIEKIQQDVFGFIAWAQKYEPEPVAMEYPFVCGGDYPYGGAIDMVARIKTGKAQKELVLIDYKSSRKDVYEAYIIQTWAYVRGWNENNPKDRIKRHFIYQPRDFRLPLGKTVTPYSFKEVTDDPACAKWDLLLQIYYSQGQESFKTYSSFSDATICITSTLEDAIIEIDPLGFVNKIQEAQNEGTHKKTATAKRKSK